MSWAAAIPWNARPAKRARLRAEMPYHLVMNIGFAVLLAGLFAWPWPAAGPLGHAVLAPLGVFDAWLMAPVVVAGFAFAWWGRVHIGALWSGATTAKPGHRVVSSGPYGLVRHPIYTGWLVAIFATAVGCGSALAVAGAGVIALSIWMKGRLEEAWLRRELGAGAYDAYARNVPMLIPFKALSRPRAELPQTP